MIQQGNDLFLYAFEDLQPIGCEVSCTINIVGQELIKTTKGSGIWTNRTYGRRDWNIVVNGLIAFSEVGKKESTRLAYRIIQGTKVIVKVDVAAATYFGIGIVLSAEFTGEAEGLSTYNCTIAADGPLHDINGQDTEPEPTFLTYNTSTFSITFSSPLLLNKTILFVLVGDAYVVPTEYTFNPDNGSGSGVITFDNAQTSGQTVKIIYS